MNITILGTKWKMVEKPLGQEKYDGYTDPYEHLIVIRNDNAYEVGDFEELVKIVKRHEIVHAYMYESGLNANWEHPKDFGHDETTVDWFAIQFPKILKTFQQVGCI